MTTRSAASTATSAGEEVGKRWPLIVLMIVLSLDLLSFTCILPLLPSIFHRYADQGDKDPLYFHFNSICSAIQSLLGIPSGSRHSTVFAAGVVGSLFSFLQFLASPILGALSDVHGRKPVLLISVLGSLASYYLWSQSSSFAIFVASRVIGGLSKASVSVAIAVVTDVCPPARRAAGMAMVGVAFSLAFMIGPMVGAYFASIARNAEDVNLLPARFAMLLAITELILVVGILPETLAPEKRLSGLGSAAWADYVSPRALFKFNVLSAEPSKRIQPYGRIYFTYLLLYSSLEFIISFLTHLRFGYTSADQGRMYFVTGVLMMIIQGGVVRRIPTHRLKDGALIGLAAIVPAYLFMAFAYSQMILYLGLVLYAVASSLVVPCLTTTVSNECAESEKGACMGVLRSLGALARAVGPVVGSLLFWLLGPTAAYTIGALALVLPCALLVSIPRKIKSK
ncbi:MFS domain-containing protein [Aphelenchoides fujianensis]|nr:MFS domain-containing protein [Aphelenchoides fujianensis]